MRVALAVFFLCQLGFVSVCSADVVRVEDWGNLPAYITRDVVDEVVLSVRGMGFECASVTHLDSFGGGGVLAEIGDGFVLSCEYGDRRYEIIHEGGQVWKVESL